MIDHLGITVSDFDVSKAFYDRAMAPLGASLLMMVPPEYTDGVKVGGYGRERPTFWISEGQRQKDHQHVAFTARLQSPPAARIMAGLACARTIIRTIMRRLFSTPTATMSKPSVMPLGES